MFVINVTGKINIKTKEKMTSGVYKRTKPVWDAGLTKETDERVRKIGDKQKGKKLSEEHKSKLSKIAIERGFGNGKLSEETKIKISLANKGKPKSEEHKNNISKSLKKSYKEGSIKHPMLGRKNPHTKEWGILMSIKMKGRKISKETKEKMKKNHKGMSGKHHNLQSIKNIIDNHRHYQSEDTKRKISDKHKGKPKPYFIGEKNPSWKGGTSKEPYSFDFDDELKMLIRRRDNFKCKICSKTAMIIHHIDYNKINSNPNNLITLCRSCHGKTNINRDKWILFFNKKIKESN